MPDRASDRIDWRAEIAARVASLRLAPEHEADLVDELSQHAEDRYAELRARGVQSDDARRTLLGEIDDEHGLAAGLTGVVRRGVARGPSIGAEKGSTFAQIAQDVKYAARAIRRSPGFGAAVILTLALGIGAATTIFSVVNNVLLAPLPYRDQEQLVTFYGTAPEKQLPRVDFPQGLFVAVRDKNTSFTSMTALQSAGFTLTGVGDPVRIEAFTVSLDFFKVFGTPPVLGRTFVAGEDTPDDNRVSVISYGLWQSVFGGDSTVIGRAIKLNGNPSTIIGVMPPEFAAPSTAQLWVPLRLDPARFSCWCLTMIGRLKPGVAPEGAARDLASTLDDFALQRPDVFSPAKRGERRVIVMTLIRELAGDLRTPLMVLLVAIGVLLLIACANIGNLLLSRAAARSRELAVRCCLGASPRRIATQLFTESAMLAAAGAAVGVALASGAVRVISRSQVEIPRIAEVRLDPLVLAFAVAVTGLCVILFGLAPAIRAARVDLQTNLKDGARGSSASGTRRLSNAFVVVQFALSLVLLAGAGLLIKSLGKILAVDPGFRADHVMTARVQPPYPRYGSDTVVRAFYERIVAGASAIPGVRAVGLTSQAPFVRGNWQDNIIAEGREPKPGEPVVVSNVRFISTGFFDAVGTRVLEGRAFNASDGPSTQRVAVVDEMFAKHFWPNQSAIGKRITHQGDTTARRWMTVVGVVPNMRQRSLDETPALQVYESHAQRTLWTMYLVVRGAIPAQSLLGALRAHVASIDPEIPLFEAQTLGDAVGRSLATRRLTNGLLTAFAVAAFALAAIGIYGVISIGVAGRKREFGVRLALGAQPGNLLQLVVRQGVILAGAGIAIGLLGATWAVQFLRGLLYGVSVFDVPTFAGATLLLAAVAVVACLIPARRATRVAPAVVLRE